MLEKLKNPSNKQQRHCLSLKKTSLKKIFVDKDLVFYQGGLKVAKKS
jgi:hypothetical protein